MLSRKVPLLLLRSVYVRSVFVPIGLRAIGLRAVGKVVIFAVSPLIPNQQRKDVNKKVEEELRLNSFAIAIGQFQSFH